MKGKRYLVLLFAIALAALLFFSILELRVASSFGFPLDDSWIFWVFAKNLATGQGFSFNPGEPVLGTTSILWVFILAGSYLVTHSVVFISKFWGVLLFLLSIFLTYRICLFHTGEEKVAFLGVLTVALSPPLVFGALSGMEISLATFLFCLTVYFHLREKGKDKRIFLSPILGGFCFAARPELISLYPLLLVHDYVNRGREKDQREDAVARSAILRKALTFVISLSPVFIFSYLVTGSLLPNTLAAKTMDSGLIWAIRNGNLNELIVSLTLNPMIWGGTMLISLVSLNALWAVFWGRGLILSSLRRDTFIYPLILLLVPMARGIVAPVGNSFSGEHRYVSFLLPLLAPLFVMGWQGFQERAPGKASAISLRKWLFLLGGISLILAVVSYANPLVGKDVLAKLFTRYYFPAIQTKSSLFHFCDFRFILCFTAVFLFGACLIGSGKRLTGRPVGRKAIYFLLAGGMVLQVGFLANRAQRYGLSIKNINQMQVYLGKWVSQNLPERSLVAVNDVGAIKFFGNRECLDLEGLVSPQIIPYKILSRDSYIVYLNRNRPDYFVIFPFWYPTLYINLGLRQRILHQVQLEDNIACGGGGYMIVAEPDWKLFDSTFQGRGLLDLKPHIPRKSFRRRWYDAQERQELWPDWRVYEKKAEEAQRNGDLQEAENFYRTAESYHPQNGVFYLMTAAFYRDKGDEAKAAKALEKSIEYQFFPFPDYRALIER